MNEKEKRIIEISKNYFNSTLDVGEKFMLGKIFQIIENQQKEIQRLEKDNDTLSELVIVNEDKVINELDLISKDKIREKIKEIDKDELLQKLDFSQIRFAIKVLYELLEE